MKKRRKSRKKNKFRLIKWFLSIIWTLFISFILLYNPLTAMFLTVVVAKENNIDTQMFYRLIATESSFFTFAYSKQKAIGLGQVQKNTALYMFPESSTIMLWFPPSNLQISATYLNYLLDKYQGNKSLALAAYNWGETNVDKKLNELRIEINSNENYRILFRNIPETYHFIGKILR